MWRLEDFHGVAIPGAGLNVLELEARLGREEFQAFDGSALMSFAQTLHQTIEVLLVAFRTGDPDPIFVLECIDSSMWEIEARDDHTEAEAAFHRVIDGWPAAG